MPGCKTQRVSFLDRTPWQLSAAIFNMCDDTSFMAFPAESIMWRSRYEETSWAASTWWESKSFVMRTNTLEILDRSSFVKEAIIQPSLARVGTTSWTAIYDVLAPATGVCIARLWSLNVLVDKPSLKPTPLPERAELLKAALPGPSSDHIAKVVHDGPAPHGAYTWHTSVRITDCDSLGHINNTKYPLLAEEAVGVAHHHGAFDDNPTAKHLASLPIVTCHVEYIDQLLPFHPLALTVWYSDSQRAFVVRFKSEDTVASYVTLGMGSAPTHSKL
eukprot:gnl/TRDRNA2_/TRDRNA2_30122_c0_seq1.p1 gnl/TRDRNA2_/TRDRNA2_30122_c0~~gnl/TRDRNA2_/TRDRNA2_30122_c0_seq1.p1  ORF type:complete len:274 (+),score=24.51 gnl/TRDRNA2_/TRDRNA2_30122_c0_seq1:61-882(+)